MNKHNAIGYLEDLLTTCDCIRFHIGKYDEAIEIAISALEKQIPKKPREHYNWCDLSEDEKLETPRWYCESCDGEIKENYSYCHDCGQRLEW